MQAIWVNLTRHIQARLTASIEQQQQLASVSCCGIHGRISVKTGMASRCNPVSRDRTKSPIVRDHHHHCHLCDVLRCNGHESQDCTNPGTWNPAGFQPSGHGRWSECFPQHHVQRWNMQHRRCEFRIPKVVINLTLLNTMQFDHD